MTGEPEMAESLPDLPVESDPPSPIYSEALDNRAEIQEIIDSSRLMGVEALSFDQMMAYITAKREYQASAYADTEAVDRARRDHELQAESRRTELIKEEAEARNKILEARYRAGLAAALVAGTVAGVIFGIIKGLPAQELTQYLAPVSGLAGIVVGYFFGRDAR
ncbi:hypothetical protein IU427_03610 [Nocardia beijingensis]|uniref:hypothetical protein n=1 Tax=Nocardia beijingensis TaxID=95162 RepID=UPI001894DC45|nr:hypothetical protein [Nocardia beijingensis]MBF6464267.1 hypothetical protein [Nocardia beijingensis]